ncbi:Transposase IS116/IS110/IS902 family protein [Sporotomaculum syntrophicum]|uniref:Transposase IS116/IS110/IS902 family protein n=1 Tax=Sporotomaculum syntrophicum TaxID=182264 RepID=A0A9D3AWV3_9FIRM|nr:IS110 family transposase [Sporotomaculum syntrophicum]KAF1083696.1 Transposase IS116/IS110/IS902 family protein [Sporotomaculum syntrophicum]
MQIRENYLYVGMDLHKDTHTAVLVNCWNEKLDVMVIENKPSEFSKLAKRVNKKANTLGLSPIYGLENAYGYGRSLAVWLIERGYTVKDVNPSLAYDQRKSAPMMKKNDEHDAYCVATVLINQLHTLPDAKPEDNHWTLSQLVNRRDTLVKDGIRLKNGLHEQVSVAYPSYHKFFCDIDRKTALYFWKNYPSPLHLKNKSAEELTLELKEIASNFSRSKAQLIIDCVQNDGDTIRDYQESRDFIAQSLVRSLEQQNKEIALIDTEIEKMLRYFDCKLTTIPGVSIATASKLIAEIGDIRRFPSADKLARYAGIAPIKFSSGGKGKEQSSKQGNRELHGLFYFLAFSMVTVPRTGKAESACILRLLSAENQ